MPTDVFYRKGPIQEVTHVDGIDIAKHMAEAGFPGACVFVGATKDGFWIGAKVAGSTQWAFVDAPAGIPFEALLAHIVQVARRASQRS